MHSHPQRDRPDQTNSRPRRRKVPSLGRWLGTASPLSVAPRAPHFPISAFQHVKISAFQLFGVIENHSFAACGRTSSR